tara:strand:- start:12591 stop:14120 length:1530 start_codon:yes stop_codon:yes gene_type:complete
MKMLDTFAGIGGFSYAAKYLIDPGIETTGFVEIDPFCQKILSKNFPNIPIYDDITTFTARPFQYDIISGGFPCQDISVAGRQKGITKTTRSGLFYELIRVIRMVRPKYIILENVSAILNNGLDIVLAELYEAGAYECEWATFPASLIGAAHQRDRWWLVGKIADTDNYGRQRREYETRNKIITRQNSQSEWSANTNHTKRQSDDGDDIRESRINENLSGSSDGGKTTSSETGRICELSEGADNNQGINSENNNQEDNYRALVSQGQSRVQLSIDRELGGDQTTLENNSIRQGDDNSSEQRVDNKGSDVTNTDSFRSRSQSKIQARGNSSSSSNRSGDVTDTNRKISASPNPKGSTWDEHEVKREHGEVETQEISRDRNSSGDTRESSNTISERMEERISGFDKELQETGSARSSDSSSDRRSTSNSNSIGTQSKDEGYNPSWKVPVGNGETRQTLSPKWRGYVSQPCLRRGDDGLRGRMDRLKALGNSVVPQCAAIPLQRVIQLEREQQ